MAIKVSETGFIYDTDGRWYPPLNKKQLEIFNDTHRYLLVHGPRMSGKTFGIIHKVLRHAFDVNGAMVAIVCKTLKNAKSAGVWLLLCRAIMHWTEHCYGFKVVDGPRTTGDTKMSFVRIQNRHGTVSEIQCHSLEHAQEVEAKFKSSCYSMYWLSEIDQFCDEHAFDILCDSLRMTPFVPFQQHQIICDCNPPDTGPNNWMHDKWFKFKDSKPDDDTGKTKIAKERLHRILVMIEDNPQLDPEAKDDLVERYRKRPKWYARFIEGKWEEDITDGHFSEVWDEDTHVLGNADGQREDWDIIVPTDQCDTLLTGWDIGDKNHSFHILEKIIREVPGTNRKFVSFSSLDEVVALKSNVSTAMFSEACLEKMDYWIKWMKESHKRDIQWRHWSDSSAFAFSATAGSVDAAVVYEATNGRVVLQAAPKYRNSNHDKVKVLGELLHLKRLHISAQCRRTRLMFANLKSGGETEYIKENEHKHPFDSLSYPILAEAPADMFKSSEVSTRKVREIAVVVAGV